MKQSTSFHPVADQQSFWSVAIGTMFIYYDYSLMMFFSPLIINKFVANGSIYAFLTKSLLVWCVIFLARPLGGIFFGFIGDFYGRRKALLITIYGVALSTLIFGLLPTYQQVGHIAFIILLSCKFLQYFCFGGEYNGSTIYAVELAPGYNEAYRSSMIMLVGFLGALIAAVLGIVLTMRGVPDYAWRWVFVISGLLSFGVVYYRRQLIESPYFVPAKKENSFLKIIKLYRLEMMASLFMGGSASLPLLTLILIVNPILLSKNLITMHEVIWLSAWLMVFSIIALYITAQVSYKIKSARLIKTGIMLMLGVTIPLFMLMNTFNIVAIIVAESLLVGFSKLITGPATAYLKNFIAMPYRYRTLAFSFSLRISLFSGLSLFLQPWLYKVTGYLTTLSLLILFVSGATLWLMYALQKKHPDLTE